MNQRCGLYTALNARKRQQERYRMDRDMPKTPDSQLIASQSYRDKMIKAGFKQIALWVPAEKAEQVKEYAKRLRGK